jgi:divalent metal cation (Fe/Co/Zn/Cd) transporter
MEFDKDILLKDAHAITTKIIHKIKDIDTNCERVIFIHMEEEAEFHMSKEELRQFGIRKRGKKDK